MAARAIFALNAGGWIPLAVDKPEQQGNYNTHDQASDERKVKSRMLAFENDVSRKSPKAKPRENRPKRTRHYEN